MPCTSSWLRTHESRPLNDGSASGEGERMSAAGVTEAPLGGLTVRMTLAACVHNNQAMRSAFRFKTPRLWWPTSPEKRTRSTHPDQPSRHGCTCRPPHDMAVAHIPEEVEGGCSTARARCWRHRSSAARTCRQVPSPSSARMEGARRTAITCMLGWWHHFMASSDAGAGSIGGAL
jgi:hypothetical protein